MRAHTCPPHIHRHDYISIVVFDLRDDNTTGNLAIRPHVEESNQTCGESTQPKKSQLIFAVLALIIILPIAIISVIIGCYCIYKQLRANNSVQATETMDRVRTTSNSFWFT